MEKRRETETVGSAFAKAVKRLSKGHIEFPEAEAEFLLTFIFKCKRHELFLDPDRILTDAEQDTVEEFIKRRLLREPAQYITGECEFRGGKFKVSRDTLIPRPETELVVEEAVKEAKRFNRGLIAIDLCTGSGCIAVSFASEVKDSFVYATDISSGALKVAEENAKINGVNENIRFLEGDLFAPLESLGIFGKAGLILSNPPYVSKDELEILQPEVRDYEPHSALYAGEGGLEFYKRIIGCAPLYLAPDGCLIMEMGYGQANDIKKIAFENGRFKDIEIKKDLSGIERVFKAQLKP